MRSLSMPTVMKKVLAGQDEDVHLQYQDAGDYLIHVV